MRDQKAMTEQKRLKMFFHSECRMKILSFVLTFPLSCMFLIQSIGRVSYFFQQAPYKKAALLSEDSCKHHENEAQVLSKAYESIK